MCTHARLAALAVIALCGSVRAATNETVTLPPVVVYGSRVDDRARDLPSAVRILDATDIARSGARNLPELLERAAHLEVRALNANPFESQVALRGFSENSFGRVKMIVDGEELNAVDMSAPNLARVSLAGLERVEVLYGPNPVLYGDGAVAGVINVVSDTYDYARKTELTAHGGSYGTFGGGVRTRGGFAEEGVLHSAAYGYEHADGYRDRSGYEAHSVDATVRKCFRNGSHVGVKSHYFNALYDMPGALTEAELRRDARQSSYGNDWCRVWDLGLSSDAKVVLDDERTLRADSAFTLRHRKSNWGDYGYANEYDLYGYHLAPRYVSEREVFGRANKFASGLDFRYDRYEVTDRSGYYGPGAHFNRGRYALFVREEHFATETLSAVAGVRVERLNTRWTGLPESCETTGDGWQADAELGLVWRPEEDVRTFLKVSRFHRSAFCDELVSTADGSVLEPEKGLSLDAGLEMRFWKEFAFDFAAYATEMRDEIFYDPHARESVPGAWYGYNCNSPDDTRRLGFESALAWRRDKVAEASLRQAFVDARFTDGPYEDARIPLVPQSRVRAEAGVWLLEDLELKGGCRHVSDRRLAGDFENAHGGMSAHTLFDLTLVYEPHWADGWRVTATVDNVFDTQYCDFAGWSDYAGSYWYPAVGRTVTLAVRYAF